MKKFLANYTALNGNVMVNHITTISDHGTLLSIKPVTAELANVKYISQPICIISPQDLNRTLTTFISSQDIHHLAPHLPHINSNNTPVIVIELNFSTHTHHIITPDSPKNQLSTPATH